MGLLDDIDENNEEMTDGSGVVTGGNNDDMKVDDDDNIVGTDVKDCLLATIVALAAAEAAVRLAAVVSVGLVARWVWSKNLESSSAIHPWAGGSR